MPNDLLGRLRLVGRLEAISFLLLLGVAMPLKYFAGAPIATKIVGWPHGVLFLGYCVLVLLARRRYRFSLALTGGLLLAALLPFGPFVAERELEGVEPRTDGRTDGGASSELFSKQSTQMGHVVNCFLEFSSISWVRAKPLQHGHA